MTPQALVSALATRVKSGQRVARADLEAVLGAGASLETLRRAFEGLEGEPAEHARSLVRELSRGTGGAVGE